jgi:drug/metabolite transporter (DMT)-like permease
MLPPPVRIDVNTMPALVAGALLLLCAAVLLLKQWWAHRRLIQSHKVGEQQFHLVERQIWMRLTVGALMLAVGIAIPVGDQLDFLFRTRPELFFFYWIIVLLLVLAMVVIAIGDALFTLAYARVTQGELRHERESLHEEIRKFQMQRGTGNDDANRK